MKKIIPILVALMIFLTGCGSTTGGIVNVHEHIQSVENVKKLLKANKETGITKTLLMGSPKETILYNGSKGFSEYDANNKVLLDIAAKYPDETVAFCTLYWSDPDQLSKFKSCMFNGAKGIKLYNGHGFFHEVSLMDDGMQPVYKYAEQHGVPLMFHVNGGKFLAEFKEVLKKYPKLKVICPHFCLLSTKLPRLETLLDENPNLYIDMSFGYIDFMKAGFKRIASRQDEFKSFFIKYQNRILFGTDTVITDAKFKDAKWLASMFQAYKDLLEKEEFVLESTRPKNVKETIKGLSLPTEVLNKIYHENFENLMAS